MSDADDSVEGEIEQIEQTLSREFGGGPIPDRFVTGQPGTSTTYHTQVCFRVANNINLNEGVEDRPQPTLTEVSHRTIGWHELTKCEACSSMESGAEEREQGL